MLSKCDVCEEVKQCSATVRGVRCSGCYIPKKEEKPSDND